MIWRQVVSKLIWVAVMLILFFPELCAGWVVCSKSPLPLVLMLGVAGAIFGLWDRKVITRRAREKIFGRDDREGRQ